MNNQYFRNTFGENTFLNKYALTQAETWAARARAIVDDVCGRSRGRLHPLLSKDERDYLVHIITNMWFLPGGRYIYYSGREANFFNNCYLLRGEEDTREEWASLAQRATSCLMTGGGIGVDYSIFRPEGYTLSRTGGTSSGPIPLMKIINEIGRNVMQGGSRRSAIYGSLNWQHEDAENFLRVKNWHDQPVLDKTLWDAKLADFNFPAPLDMTNVSLNYDNEFLLAVQNGELPDTFVENCRQALKTGEPGFSFNFGDQENDTLRNACTEVTSADDSDVCNLGSVNFGTVPAEELKDVISVASKFLVCGTIRADLPYNKVYEVREKNRRLGLGLMGIHEWLLKNGQSYEVSDDLRGWLQTYKDESEKAANEHCDRLYLSRPVAYRAIAPTGSIGILAGTTTGIEPLFATMYKRRYLTQGTKWKYEYVKDPTAEYMINEYGVKPDDIETALSLAEDPERRIRFQAEVQDYVDMAISSTINLPEWGSKLNNEDRVLDFARTLSKYAGRLRGFTCYPDGARGGQPLTPVDYEKYKDKTGVVYEEHDICDITGHGGTCGV